MIKSVITLSDSYFHRKILSKYKKGKRNSFNFPIMIFYKNTGQALSQRINVDFLIRLHFYGQSTGLPSIAKSVQGMKELFLWFKTEKLIPQSILRSAPFKRGNNMVKMQHEAISKSLAEGYISVNRKPMFSFMNSIFSRTQNIAVTLNRVLRPLFSSVSTVIYPQVDSHVSYGDYVHIVNPHMWDIRSSRKTLNAKPTARIENIWEYHSLFKHISSAILSQSNLSLNNSTLLNATFYPRTVYNVSLTDGADNSRFLMYNNHVQIINPQMLIRKSIPKSTVAGRYISTQKEDIPVYQYLFEYKSPAILPKDNLFLSNSTLLYKSEDLFNRKSQNSMTFIKPVIKYDYHKYRHYADVTVPLQKRDVLKNSDNFYFQNHRKIEQEIENVKKIAEEAKETVAKISVPDNSSRKVDMHKIDINRISDQVYQNIERRIRIEKQRRGI